MTLPDISVLRDLKARVEGAEKDDRELDRSIHAGLGLDMNLCVHAGAQWNCYTVSIDAAAALVEQLLPGWSYMAGKSGSGAPGMAEVWDPMCRPGDGNGIRYVGGRGNPALALIVAMLSALIAKAERSAARDTMVEAGQVEGLL